MLIIPFGQSFLLGGNDLPRLVVMAVYCYGIGQINGYLLLSWGTHRQLEQSLFLRTGVCWRREVRIIQLDYGTLLQTPHCKIWAKPIPLSASSFRRMADG